MSAYQQNVQSVGVVTVALGILLFSASAMAGTTGEVFLAVYEFVNDAALGYLGRAIAIAGGLIGLGVGAATGKPIAAIMGIVLAVFGALGPVVIDTIFASAVI